MLFQDLPGGVGILAKLVTYLHAYSNNEKHNKFILATTPDKERQQAFNATVKKNEWNLCAINDNTDNTTGDNSAQPWQTTFTHHGMENEMSLYGQRRNGPILAPLCYLCSRNFYWKNKNDDML